MTTGYTEGNVMSELRTIAVLGATGMVGSRVVKEAGARGRRVLALSRKPASDSPLVTPVAVDAHDRQALRKTLENLAAQGGAPPVAVPDAVVVTLRTLPVDPDFLVGATRTVLEVAARHGIRVLVVGGAGALRSPGDPDLLVADDPRYVPPEYRAVAAAGIAQLRACQAHSAADWVYLSPPVDLEPGERTGRYRRGRDALLTTPDGHSWISAEDLAVAALDELDAPGPERHFTVVHHDG